MNTETACFDVAHRMGDYATHPIARPARRPAALLLLAGMSPPRRRALPADTRNAHSDASNDGF